MLGASDVRGGTALLPAGKTTGGAVTATIVTDVTNLKDTQGNPIPGSPDPNKGLTSVRVQKAGTTAAVIFYSSYVHSFRDECIPSGGFSLQTGTANRFTGLMDGFVDTPAVLNALLQQFGTPSKAAIINQDYVACTSVAGRQILSFTATIQFQP